MTANGVMTANAVNLISTRSSTETAAKSETSVSFGKLMTGRLRNGMQTGSTDADIKASDRASGRYADTDTYRSGDRADIEDRRRLFADRQQSSDTGSERVIQGASQDSTQAAEGQNSIAEDTGYQTADETSKTKADALLFMLGGADAEKARLLDFLKEVKKAVSDILGVSQEELEKMMEGMGMTIQELINPEALQKLVLEANGVQDISDALLDANIGEQLKSVYQTVDGMLEAKSDGHPEELRALIAGDEFGAFLKHNVMKNENDSGADGKLISYEITEENGGEIQTGKEVQNSELQNGEDSADAEANTKTEASSRVKSSAANMETTPTGADSFIQRLEAAAKAEAVNTGMTNELAARIREIAYQITEQIKVVIAPEKTSLDMQLNPESLGRIQLSITSKEGVMTAQFTAQTQVAKEAIESQIQVLRENIENQGVKVEAIEVTLSEFAFSQSGNTESDTGEQHKENRRNININAASFLDDATEEEKLVRNIMEQNGSTVDYTA